MDPIELSVLCPAVEAVLFAAGDSVPVGRMAQVLGVSEEEVASAAQSLAEDYISRRRGIRLVRMENSLQLASAPEYADEIVRCLEKRRNPRLSQTALEVLAIVAYFQPVTRAYIEQMRGVDSSYTVSALLQRGLIEPCGHLDAPGRPVLFCTGEAFLRTMGIRSLDELPPLPDLSTDGGLSRLQAAVAEAENSGQMSIGAL
jgi:segregation and condensation protein B